MKAIEYLKGLPREYLPKNRERGGKAPSNSYLWRWLEKGSVIINGETPKPKEGITLPIEELIFFPKGRRVTIVKR